MRIRSHGAGPAVGISWIVGLGVSLCEDSLTWSRPGGSESAYLLVRRGVCVRIGSHSAGLMVGIGWFGGAGVSSCED